MTSVPAAIQATGREGASSVFNSIARTAERVEDGVRWQTLDYEDQPHYDPNTFNGVSGIVFFLADYYRLTGDATALELAKGAADWCSAPDRRYRGRSIGFGRAGVGIAWLRLYDVTRDAHALTQARAFADPLLKGSPGPKPGFLFGAAGMGLFLLRLWEAAKEPVYLEAATEHAAWIESQAIHDVGGCLWPMDVRSEPIRTAPGFCQGSAGIAHFLVALFRATQDERWAALARAGARKLQQTAVADHGGLNWPGVFGETGPLPCQWCRGAAGVGLFFTRAYEALGADDLLTTALAAARTTYARGDVRQNPCQCHGLSGNAELFLELYRVTGDAEWLDKAHDFAGRALAYRARTPEGDVWQADTPGRTSPDFLCGAAGAGHFFLRLQDPDRLTMPLL